MKKHLYRRWLILALGFGLAGFTLSSCKHNNNSTSSGVSHSGQSVVTVRGANS